MKKGIAKMWLMILLVALAIVCGVPLIAYSQVLFSFFTPHRDAEAKANFEAFNQAITTLIEDENQLQELRTPLKVPSGYTIIAYDYDFVNGEIIKGKGDTIKPSDCGYDSCICLFDKNIKFGSFAEVEKGKIKCIPHTQSIAFYAKDEKAISGNIKTQGILATDCGTTCRYLALKGESFETHDVLLKKEESGGTNYVYFSVYE